MAAFHFANSFHVYIFGFFLNIDISMLSGLVIQDLQHGIRLIASLISTLSPEGMRCTGQKLNNLFREEGLGVLFFRVGRREAVNPSVLLTGTGELNSHGLHLVLSKVTFCFYANIDLIFLNFTFNKINSREGAQTDVSLQISKLFKLICLNLHC